MKKSFLLLLVTALVFAGNTQVTNGDTTHHSTLLFASFKPGYVKMKSGSMEKADLNYDAYSHQVVFLRDKEQLELTALDEVDSIFFGGRKFIPLKKTVYEVLETGDPVTLLVMYDAKVKPLTSTVGHDGYSKKDSREVMGTITSSNLNRSRYQNEYNIELERTFYFLRYKDLYKSATEKQVLKAFPESSSEKIKAYLKEHKVDLKNPEQLLALMRYVNTK